VYRVQRTSTLIGPDTVRYVLRAVPVKQDGQPGHEVARDIDAAHVRDKLAMRQAIPTPEDTFEALWQQLRVDLNVQYD
jgi:hypothetical protein